jgi:hypothetical protein
MIHCCYASVTLGWSAHHMQGYDVSFLVTAEHVAPPGSGAQVIDFIVRFIEDVGDCWG